MHFFDSFEGRHRVQHSDSGCRRRSGFGRPFDSCKRRTTILGPRVLGLERLDLARALCDLALSEDERSADTQSVAANILDRQSDWQSSLACLRRAYALAPQAPHVRLNLAMALLRCGDYREGFALYEARVEKPGWSGFATSESRAALRHRMLRPGQSVEGKGILVLAEQGLGDGIVRQLHCAVDRARCPRGRRLQSNHTAVVRACRRHREGARTASRSATCTEQSCGAFARRLDPAAQPRVLVRDRCRERAGRNPILDP
jgi:hypothetical protein